MIEFYSEKHSYSSFVKFAKVEKTFFSTIRHRKRYKIRSTVEYNVANTEIDSLGRGSRLNILLSLSKI